MKIGILSDTHGLLRPQVLRHLEGVDHILHAGDIGSLGILVELEALAPVTAVAGNTDGWEVRHRVPNTASMELDDLRFTVIHGHLPEHGTSPERLARAFPDSDVVVFGHTHQPLLHLSRDEPGRGGPRWILNPGSCGPRRFNLPVSLILAEMREAELHPELVELDGG